MADDWDRKKTRSRACLECEMYSSSRLVLGETVTNVFTMLIGLLLSFFPFFFSFFLSISGGTLCTLFFFFILFCNDRDIFDLHTIILQAYLYFYY